MKDYYPKLSITEYVKRYGSPNETINKSYSHKPHLANLPHDRRTNDPEKLQERIDKIDERLEENDEKTYFLENENIDLNHQKDSNNKEIKEFEDNIKKIDDKISKEESNIKDYIEEYNNNINRGFQKWEKYKGGLYGGYEDFTGPVNHPWNSRKYEQVKAEVESIDKEIQKLQERIKGKKYEDMTPADLREIYLVNHRVSSFMKDNYDHQTEGMEMIWFEYGDPFSYPIQLNNLIEGSEKKITQMNTERTNQEKQINSLNNKNEKIEENIKINEKELQQLETEGFDYVEEKKKCEAKMKDIKKD